MSELDRTPLFARIADEIGRRIVAGAIQPGEKIPTQREIMDEWGVSMATAAKIAPTLRAMNLIETRHGIGSVAKSQHGTQQRLENAKNTGKIYPPGHKARIVKAEIVVADKTVAKELQLPTGNNAVVRRVRVTEALGVPVSTSTSYFDAHFATEAPELLREERIIGGTSGLIGKRYGMEPRSGREEVMIETATPEIAKLLGVGPGDPVLQTRCWIMDGDKVIEYAEGARKRGQSTAYEYKL